MTFVLSRSNGETATYPPYIFSWNYLSAGEEIRWSGNTGRLRVVRHHDGLIYVDSFDYSGSFVLQMLPPTTDGTSSAITINGSNVGSLWQYRAFENPSGVVAPVADFAAGPLSGDTPLSVVFADLSWNNPTSWLWNFGDGLLSAERSPTHVYNRPSVYTVSLRSDNSEGFDFLSKPNLIEAIQPPVPPPALGPTWTIQIGEL